MIVLVESISDKSTNALNKDCSLSFMRSGNSLLHMAALSKNESAGLFLIEHGAQVNHINKKGESPLHVSAQNGLVELVDRLLKR